MTATEELHRTTKWEMLQETLEAYFKAHPQVKTFYKHDLDYHLLAGYKHSTMDRYLAALVARGALHYKKNKYTILIGLKELFSISLDLSGRKDPDPPHKGIDTYIPPETCGESHLKRFMREKRKEAETPIQVTRTPKLHPFKRKLPEILDQFLSTLTLVEAQEVWNFLEGNPNAEQTILEKLAEVHSVPT